MTAPRPLQSPLPIRIPGLVPLMSIEGARELVGPLGCDEMDIREWIDGGELQWAFNISSGAEVREVRIYRPSLEQWVKRLEDPRFRLRSVGLDDVLHSLFPTRGRKPFVTTPEVARAFNCESDTVLELVRARLLRLLPNTTIHAGGHAGSGAAVIDFDSVRKFLEARSL